MSRKTYHWREETNTDSTGSILFIIYLKYVIEKVSFILTLIGFLSRMRYSHCSFLLSLSLCSQPSSIVCPVQNFTGTIKISIATQCKPISITSDNAAVWVMSALCFITEWDFEKQCTINRYYYLLYPAGNVDTHTIQSGWIEQLPLRFHPQQ